MASSGEAAATSKRVTGPTLPVGDRHPLAQHAVVLGPEAQPDLERAVGVDQHDLGAGSGPPRTSSNRSRVVVVPSLWVTRRDGARKMSSS